MDDSPHVHFVELAGAHAPAALEDQAERWRSHGVRTRLLRSAEQEGLWLLVGEADTPPPATAVEGARVWRFERAPEPSA
jgi:hypothetical protein